MGTLNRELLGTHYSTGEKRGWWASFDEDGTIREYGNYTNPEYYARIVIDPQSLTGVVEYKTRSIIDPQFELKGVPRDEATDYIFKETADCIKTIVDKFDENATICSFCWKSFQTGLTRGKGARICAPCIAASLEDLDSDMVSDKFTPKRL